MSAVRSFTKYSYMSVVRISWDKNILERPDNAIVIFLVKNKIKC